MVVAKGLFFTDYPESHNILGNDLNISKKMKLLITPPRFIPYQFSKVCNYGADIYPLELFSPHKK